MGQPIGDQSEVHRLVAAATEHAAQELTYSDLKWLRHLSGEPKEEHTGGGKLAWDRIYSINLGRRRDRAEMAERSLAGLEYYHWFAVDSQDLHRSSQLLQKCVAPDERGWLKLGQIGCHLSHVTVARNMLQNGLHRVLVLEDDARIKQMLRNDHSRYGRMLDRHTWDLVHLKRTPLGGADHELEPGLLRSQPAWNTMAYGLSRTGALKVLGWLSMQWHAVDVQLSELHRLDEANQAKLDSLCQRIPSCQPGDLTPFANLAFEPQLASDANLPGTDTVASALVTALALPTSSVAPGALVPTEPLVTGGDARGATPREPWYRGPPESVPSARAPASFAADGPRGDGGGGRRSVRIAFCPGDWSAKSVSLVAQRMRDMYPNLDVMWGENLLNPHVIVSSYWGRCAYSEAESAAAAHVQVDMEPNDHSGDREWTITTVRPNRAKWGEQRYGAILWMPYALWSFGERKYFDVQSMLQSRQEHEARKMLGEKSRFAALVSRYCSYDDAEHPPRAAIFDELSKYKRVDGLSGCRRNAEPPEGAWYGDNERDQVVGWYTPYKFCVAFENSRLKGYMTEKLINCRLAGAVPIYLGAFEAEYMVNKDALVLCDGKDDASIRACVERVKTLDQDDAAYLRMLRAPLFKNGERPRWTTWDPVAQFLKNITVDRLRP